MLPPFPPFPTRPPYAFCPWLGVPSIGLTMKDDASPPSPEAMSALDDADPPKSMRILVVLPPFPPLRNPSPPAPLTIAYEPRGENATTLLIEPPKPPSLPALAPASPAMSRLKRNRDASCRSRYGVAMALGSKARPALPLAFETTFRLLRLPPLPPLPVKASPPLPASSVTSFGKKLLLLPSGRIEKSEIEPPFPPELPRPPSPA